MDKKEYVYQYHKEHVRRVALNMQHKDYDKIKAAADAAGETVSGYIKESVRRRMDAEKEGRP